MKSLSSEELLHHIDNLVCDLEDDEFPEDGICIGSLDVEAFYPSLDIEDCAKLCGDSLPTVSYTHLTLPTKA